MINRRSLLVLPGVLAVTGCMPRALEIEVSGTARAIEIAAFRYVDPFELFRVGAKIAGVAIWRADGDPHAPLWQSGRSQCESAGRVVRYEPPAPLAEDVDYSVGVEDCGPSGGGGANFRIVGGRVQQFWTIMLQRAD